RHPLILTPTTISRPYLLPHHISHRTHTYSATTTLFISDSSFSLSAPYNFFSKLTSHEPLPLSSHEFHWIDLAKLANETQPTPVRSLRPLFNMYADRSEGFAAAMEEIAMQEGIYDDEPHGRELVWAMLANRAARGLASL